jgi:hypothetical protein
VGIFTLEVIVNVGTFKSFANFRYSICLIEIHHIGMTRIPADTDAFIVKAVGKVNEVFIV